MTLLLFFTHPTLFAQKPSVFEIEIIQNGSKIPVEENTVYLYKSSFAIKVIFYDSKNVFLNILTSPEYFALASNTSIDVLQDMSAMVYAEYPKNLSRQLFIDMQKPYGFHLLALESDNNNRGFDEIELSAPKQGRRTIDSLFVMHDFDNRENIQFRDFSQELFLTFLSREKNADQNFTESQRTVINIKWKE